jgi:hypothetical protein
VRFYGMDAHPVSPALLPDDSIVLLCPGAARAIAKRSMPLTATIVDTDCRDIYTGERVTGPANLSQAELAAN